MKKLISVALLSIMALSTGACSNSANMKQTPDVTVDMATENATEDMAAEEVTEDMATEEVTEDMATEEATEDMATEEATDDMDSEEATDDMATDNSQVEGTEFTAETLAQYNGENGNKAYVAINGVVYDVTDNKEWANGTHQGQMAGKDLTEILGNAPHGDSVLGSLPVVGTYVN